MTPHDAITEAFRNDWSSVVAYLIHITADWDLAEECAQDAYAKALERWPHDGVPANPVAWLKTTARNRAIDRLRRSNVGAAKLREVAMSRTDSVPDSDGTILVDERLRLIFTCCHPALRLEAQVALALRTLAGLTTVEIARAFMVPTETMAKRLVRAKQKIRDAGIPYRVPPPNLLPERTVAVLAVLYGLFNEGYSASDGAEQIRQSLCEEAIRLARLLARLMPDDPEVLGLLALMLFHDARREARVDATGDIVTLDAQDRTKWNAAGIAEAITLLDRAIAFESTGSYQIQAAIAACHSTAASAADTDWVRIAALYERLRSYMPTAVVALNHAVAFGRAYGPVEALALIDEIERTGELDGYYLLPATRADLLERLGRTGEANICYRKAFELAPTDAERRHLAERIRRTAEPC